jgi:hypothetical protein
MRDISIVDEEAATGIVLVEVSGSVFVVVVVEGVEA